MSSSEIDPTETAAAIWKKTQQAIRDDKLDEFSEESVQQLMTSAVKLFAAKVEADDRFFLPVLERDGALTATEVVVAVSEILRAVDLNPFDLAMWFNRHRPTL
ncbi:MAG: hypothetical protein IIB03_07645 [Acidobacteria bacterium]|nr:hypothetical protein [Acidobacteriota bacterium]